MRSVGLSNILGDSYSLFFFEFDNLKLEEVIEESKILSKFFDLTIWIAESSPNNYHIISFEVLPNTIVDSIQNMISLPSDYIPRKEQKLYGNIYGSNVLRIVKKGTKEAPKFLQVVKCPSKVPVVIANNHFILWGKITKIPKEIIQQFINNNIRSNFPIIFSRYKTGIGAKRDDRKFR